jgi:transcriptional regulator with XRE-family HTH domain
MNSKELIKWRRRNNYSQSQLALALDVDVMTISRWERGIRKQIPSYLHLALECLEMKGGIRLIKGKKNTKKEV